MGRNIELHVYSLAFRVLLAKCNSPTSVKSIAQLYLFEEWCGSISTADEAFASSVPGSILADPTRDAIGTLPIPE